MRFVCTRTSNYDETVRPCESATLATFTYVDRRKVDNPNKDLRHTDWYRVGKNHRVENGKVVRDFEEERWFVELNSMEELRAFISKHGQVAIEQRDDSVEPYLVLEIYDTYRE